MRQSLLAVLAPIAMALAVLLAGSGCATTGASSSTSKTALASAKRHGTKHSAHKSSAAAAHATAAKGDDDDDDDDDDNDRDDKGDGEGERQLEQELTALAVTEGAASFYHDGLTGKVTANGEKYDPDASTCAHRSLPFGTVLVIEDVVTGKKSHCRVNDRGPYVDGRLIDVSRRVARDLNMIDRGVIRVRIRVAKPPTAS